MRYLNGWHPFESIRFDLDKNYYVAMPSSSDLGAKKTASTKTKSNSIRDVFLQKYCRQVLDP